VTPGTPAASATTKKEAMPAPRSVELPPMDASKSSNRPPEVPVQLEKPPTPETVVKEEPPAKTDTKTAATNLPPLPEKGKTPAPETKPDTKSAAKATETKMAKSQNGLDDPLAEELLEPVSGAAKKTGAAKPAAAAAAPSAGGGQFGIQVGAFPGPNREAQANDMKKRVDAAGLKSEIRPSKDKQYYRVVIVGFKDRASAISALNGLKQRPGFEKSFVQDLSKI
jgi:cell division protein FtsN